MVLYILEIDKSENYKTSNNHKKRGEYCPTINGIFGM